MLTVTLEKARQAGLSSALIDQCSDVDTLDDIKLLQRGIKRLRRTPGAQEPVHAEEWLRSLGSMLSP